MATQGNGARPGIAGLRRVDWVRLDIDHAEVRAEAIGVGFRLPTTCPIPLAVASQLIASGTPHVVHGVQSLRSEV